MSANRNVGRNVKRWRGAVIVRALGALTVDSKQEAAYPS